MDELKVKKKNMRKRTIRLEESRDAIEKELSELRAKELKLTEREKEIVKYIEKISEKLGFMLVQKDCYAKLYKERELENIKRLILLDKNK